MEKVRNPDMQEEAIVKKAAAEALAGLSQDLHTSIPDLPFSGPELEHSRIPLGDSCAPVFM